MIILKKNNGFVIPLTSVIAVLLVMIYIPTVSGLYKLLSCINAELVTIFLFTYPQRPYSLHKIVNLFLLFFFIIANAMQFSTHNVVSTVTVSFDDYDYVSFQFVVLFIIVIFNGTYGLFNHGKTLIAKSYCPNYSSKRLLIVSLISVFIVLWSYRNNMMHLFVRGLIEDLDGSNGDVEASQGYVGYLIIEKIVRVIPFACMLIACNAKLQRSTKIVLFIFMTISLFPLGLARNAVAMYWLPLFLIIFKFFIKGYRFILLMLVGLLVVFPFLEIFRFWDGNIHFSYSLDFLNSLHFDASQEFMIIMKKDLVTWGGQLLGAFLFFVPRSLWPNKPIGSGAFLAETDGAFPNISMPFFGEGYINFGYIGIGLFTLFCSYFCSRMDVQYWSRFYCEDRFKPYYLLLVGALFFIMRGDLMSSFAFTLGSIISIVIVEKCTIVKEK